MPNQIAHLPCNMYNSRSVGIIIINTIQILVALLLIVYLVYVFVSILKFLNFIFSFDI